MPYDFNDSDAIDILEESIKRIRQDNRDKLGTGEHLPGSYILHRAIMHLAASGNRSLLGQWFDEPLGVE